MIHVLNGDALGGKFPLKGSIVVCREALIDGPSQANSLGEFWNARSGYFAADGVTDQEYYARVQSEFEKLLRVDYDEVNLWFEYDLFCQVNLWFVLYFLDLHKRTLPLFSVTPPLPVMNAFVGFGNLNASDLVQCFRKRKPFSPADVRFGASLWVAYASHDSYKLKELSESFSPSFPLLKQIVQAQLARFPEHSPGRPEARLAQLIDEKITDFDKLFIEFQKTEGIYGFGDLQVKKILSRMRQK